jgi:hypothetical protein
MHLHIFLLKMLFLYAFKYNKLSFGPFQYEK